MQAARRLRMSALLGLGLLGLILLPLAWLPAPGAPPATRLPPLTRVASDSPSQAALREVKWEWGQAQMALKPEQEAFAEAKPYTPWPVEKAFRQQVLARDRGGHLDRAHKAARRAVALARTPDEEYPSTVWIAIIECDRSRHQAELQHVQRLVVLQPRDPVSLGALRRAARCNGLELLAEEADRALQAQEETPLTILVEANPAAARRILNSAGD
jgi:hypothetical protein